MNTTSTPRSVQTREASPNLRREILRLLTAGFPTDRICLRLGIRQSTISRVIQKFPCSPARARG